MRYLKPFNENKPVNMYQQFIDEVEEFSKELLAYLCDSGCTIKFSELPFYRGLCLNFSPSVSWDSIEQYIIPFYEILKETYYLDKEGVLEIRFEAGSGEFDINTYELGDHRMIVTADVEEPLDSITRIMIKFDNARIYGKFNYERFKKF